MWLYLIAFLGASLLLRWCHKKQILSCLIFKIIYSLKGNSDPNEGPSKSYRKEPRLVLDDKIENWAKEHVKQWVINELKLEEKHGNVLLDQGVTGSILKTLTKEDLLAMGMPHDPAIKIIHAMKENDDPKRSTMESRQGHSTEIFDGKLSNESKDGRHMEANNEMNYDDTCKQTGFAKLECTESPESVLQEKTKNILHQDQSNHHPTRQTCLPHPFDEFHNSHRYIEHYVLHIPETGPLNLIDPVHEFKLFTNTDDATEENLKMKFCNEVFRFAAACMNSRTNGTIHLGIGDNPHGEIIGVKVQNKEKYINYFDQMIKKYFVNTVDVAKDCIRKPRFVEVLHQNGVASETFVIEVDVIPKSSSCQSKYFITNTYNFKSKTLEPGLFIRDGAASKNIPKNKKEYKLFKSTLQEKDVNRKEAEEEHAEKIRKTADEGHKLVRLLTGNKDLLDNSYYDWYILVTNKCHRHDAQHVSFLQEMNVFAALDFDPESVSSGVVKTFRENRAANLHFPKQYQKPLNSASDTIHELNLYQQPSWIFCNGRSDLNSEAYQPLNPSVWQQQRAAEVRKLISFLSHPDVMQRGRFLVLFILLSKVEDPGDPMIETLCAFYQELKGLDDMLCICIGTQTYHRWKDLLKSRFIDADKLADRCISALTLPMVNGTIQKLKSVTQTSQRLLPSKGGSSTILLKKDEDFMAALEILCQNECQDTEIEKDKEQFSKFKKDKEEHFYRGGKAIWWNFYFSSEHYSSSFIKQDAFEKLKDLIVSGSPYSKQSPTKIINLYHHPGCGGTTLAMHILWELRNKLRCVVLKNKTVDFLEIGRQLTTLITSGTSNKFDYLPVLLLVDDFEEQENVYHLQHAIQSAIAEHGIRYENPLVFILNCMRSQNPEESAKNNSLNSIALKQKLSLKEQRAFEEKLKEIECQYDHPEDFYSFMIMKENFHQEYIENVVKNTLKGLDVTSKQVKLISFLALLNSYVTESTISVSQCEEFLGISTKKTYWGPEKLDDKMGNCSNIIVQAKVQECGQYKAVRISHSLIAVQCLEEFKQTYKLTKSEITLLLLRENSFYEVGIGKDKLQQDVQSMLLTRHRREHGDDTDTLFSPLIEAIQREEENKEVVRVLKEGTNRFSKNVFISQALARHFYIKEKNFDSALEWARRAKRGAPNNSYISDTLGQVFKSEIKHWLEENTEKPTITVEIMDDLLNLAKCASDAFKESQRQTENKDSEGESYQDTKHKRRYEMYNTSGYSGEIETGLYAIKIIAFTPLFNKKDDLSRKHITQFLSGNCDIPKVTSDTDCENYSLILKKYANYLSKLQVDLKNAFDFFDNYYIFLKPKNPEKETVEFKIRNKIQELFKKYAEFFCYSHFDWLKKSKLSSSLLIENYRKSLEVSKADKFSGILEYLGSHENAVSKMEDIVKKYADLLAQSSTKFIQRDKLNFILANIVLHCLSPKSKMVHSFLDLREQLKGILQSVGPEHRYSEPYFLASLLFWPEKHNNLDKDNKQMEKYLSVLNNAFNSKYWKMSRSKRPTAFFYLGKGSHLNKFIHKGKLDQCVTTKIRHEKKSKIRDTLNAQWQSGEIWKTDEVKRLLQRLTGKVEGDQINHINVDYGTDEDIKIPARPVYLGKLKSGHSIERVSFYLGFSIGGLIAYDIEII